MRIPRFMAMMAITAALGGGASCGDSTGPGGNSVSVEDNLFDPANLTVASATTVTWTWNGTVDHNVTWEGAGAPAPSPTQTTGTYTRSFSTAGTFDYFCTIHGQGMSGTITVQ
jgi:plastocyanin